MPPRSFLTASIVTSISCLIDKFYIITLYMFILYHIFMNSIILYHTIYTLHIHIYSIILFISFLLMTLTIVTILLSLGNGSSSQT
jgi:hypothetical protein